jgi:hypothetical protein
MEWLQAPGYWLARTWTTERLSSSVEMEPGPANASPTLALVSYASFAGF